MGRSSKEKYKATQYFYFEIGMVFEPKKKGDTK